jgi:2,6-dihydroxypseudooxynicotine hydrolase
MDPLIRFGMRLFTRLLGGKRFFEPLYCRWIGNGADYADVMEVMSRIRSYRDWPIEWEKMARRYEGMADAAALKVDKREQYLLACHYYHLAQWGIYEVTHEKKELQRKSRECYQKAIPWVDFTIENVEIKAGSRAFNGFFCHRGERAPGLLLIHGADSSKEELHIFVEEAIERGLNVLMIDGPGQGDARLERDVYMDADSEQVYSAALDLLDQSPLIDSERIGVWGVSFGGHWSIKLAATDSRVKACVSLGGPYRPGYVFGRRIPPPLSNIRNIISDVRSIPRGMKRKTLVQAMLVLRRLPYVFGVKNLREVRNAISRVTLDGFEERVQVPVLIINGKADMMCPPYDLETLHERIASPSKQIEILDESDHCCTPTLKTQVRPRILSWLVEQLG